MGSHWFAPPHVPRDTSRSPIVPSLSSIKDLPDPVSNCSRPIWVRLNAEFAKGADAFFVRTVIAGTDGAVLVRPPEDRSIL